MGLGMFGLDFETAFSGAATSVANVGPGIGRIIGPAGNFSTLPDAAKWLLSLGMIVGRLEIVTMAVLLMPDFWRG
jgi:trk system potassium uptake protein TrkH